MKLKNIFFITMLVLSIIPLAIWSYYSINSQNKTVENIIEDNVELSAAMLVSSINNFFKEQERTLDIIIDYNLVLDIINSANQPESAFHTQNRKYMDNILKMRVAKNEYIKNLTLLDSNYKILSCSQETKDNEISEFKDFSRPLDKDKTSFYRVKAPNHDDSSKKGLIGVKPIYQQDRHLGYIVEEIDLVYFEELRLSASVFDKGIIYIIDDEQNLVSAGSGNNSIHQYVSDEKERSNFNAKMQQAIESHKTEGILRYTAMGGNYITYFSKLSPLDWTVLISINIDQVIAKQQSYKLLFFTALFLIIILLITANFLVSNKISKPVTSMIKILGTIKANNDYSQRIPSIKSTEMHTLATEINSLLSYIEEHINAQKLKEQKLQKKVQQDPLTGLYNKKEMHEIIQNHLQKAIHDSSLFALIFIDIDDFKNFNSKYGHLGGDKVLVFVGKVLIDNYGSYIGRVGGDEFAACISNPAQITYIEEFTQNVLETLNTGVDLGIGSPISICCSIGIVVYSKSELSSDELIAEADNAMYKAKEKGKNNYYIIRN